MDPTQFPNHSLDVNAGIGFSTFSGAFSVAQYSPPVTELTGQTFNFGLNYSRYIPAGPLRLQLGGGVFYEFSTGRGATTDALDRPLVWAGIASHGPGLNLEAGLSYPTGSLEVFLKLRASVLYSNGDAGEMLLGTLNPQVGLRLNLARQALGLGLGPVFGTALVSSGPVDFSGGMLTTTYSF